MVTSFPQACLFQFSRVDNILRGVSIAVDATIKEDSNDQITIPEPDPIRPDGAIEVVPYIPLLHGKNWKQLKNFKELMRSSPRNVNIGHSSYMKPLLVQSSFGIGSEWDNNHFKRECMDVGDEGCGELETVSTATDTMSACSGIDSCPSLRSLQSSPLPLRKEGIKHNFQEKQWEDKFSELGDFQQKYGHLNVPHDDSNQQVSEIGNSWCTLEGLTAIAASLHPNLDDSTLSTFFLPLTVGTMDQKDAISVSASQEGLPFNLDRRAFA
jgi:hypothetical protein